ncbi:E3 ubiquitin-protein ligase Arkadia [Camellia lanceoleosa]|uniref:E3 ubiquitin-protein ligase Arkadia n=1 Tax=Camellia lanceoleosa TaxID=1840588 RepID=A0ACC0HXD9_9ERIC|nr:E3 ubiquitin-protein ligase Arkadia [Camellia lanceoleosa]
MIIKKLASIFCSLIGLRPRPRIKDSSSYEAIESNVAEDVKEGSMGSQGGSRFGRVVESKMCCVCLSRMEEREDTRVLACLHEFHRVCIDRWLSVCRKTCPVCRFLVEEEEEEERFQTREELTEEMVIWFSSFHVAGF